jgi:iron complex transport system permease protein
MAEPAERGAATSLALARGIATTRLPARWLVGSIALAIGALLASIAFGPAHIPIGRVAAELVDRLPFVHVDSGLSPLRRTIVTEYRLPRALLAFIVGAVLATAGGAYQGVFRNPLADPYLLGVASGAGFGVTTVISLTSISLTERATALPIAAFAGALVAVAMAYALGMGADRLRSDASLILSGVAVAALFTAAQTFLLQQDDESIRDVYAWLLGQFNVAGWRQVALLAPYAAVSIVVLVATARHLDVMAVGDDEAAALGLQPRRVRLLVVVAASLGTAAAVAVSGLIGFVGIIVPHTVRLLSGASYRRIIPLATILGGAFLCLADLVARSVLSPAEVPIGVVTALAGAPFFLVVLRTRRVVGP